MSFDLRAFRALTLASLRMYVRNPVATFALFGLLVLLLAGVRYLDQTRAPHYSIELADEAHTPVAGALIDDLRQTPRMDIRTAEAAAAEADARARKVDLGIVLPDGFGRVGADGKLQPSALRLYFRESGQGAAVADLVRAAVDREDRRAQGAPQALSVQAVTANAGLGLIDVFLPGLLGFNVINSAPLLAAGVFAGYRSSGTLRRVQATGTDPNLLVLAHAASNMLLAAVQVAAMIAAAMLIFGTTRLNAPALWLVAMAGYLVFLSIGFVISGWVRDPQRSTAVATAVAMPLIFIGLFPPETFSGVVATVVGWLPIALVTDGMRRVLEGGGIFQLGRDLPGLLAWAVVMLALAGRAFRWDE